MSNMLIVYRNYADIGLLSGGSWQPTLPIGNLADRHPSRVARTTGTPPEDTLIEVDVGEARPIRFIGLLRHNLTQSARWRIRTASGPELSGETYDSGWLDAWPAVVPFGVGVWGEFNWGGRLNADEARAYGIAALHLIDAAPRHRFVRIDLDDADNPAGYLEAGRLLVAPAWQPTVNLQHGWSIEQVDDSRIVRSLGGQAFVDVKPKYRRLRFTLEHLGADEMFGNAYELERLKGKGGDVLVMVDPEQPTHRHRQTVYGMLAETTPISNPYHTSFAKEFVVEELV